MPEAQTLHVDDDFEYLLTFLPLGWEAKAKELGALRRCRKIKDAHVLLRLLLIHLAEGWSLRQTAMIAKRGHIAEVSDVAIMERLRYSGEWFRWMSEGLMARWVMLDPRSVFCGQFHVRMVDATHVSEPGPTGSSWRIHYSVSLPSLCCSDVQVTEARGPGSGESLTRFAVQPGDLILGDRAYGMTPGVAHVVDGGGDVLVRFGWNNLPLWVDADERFDLLAHLRELSGTTLGDWPVFIKAGKRLIAGRVCALKRSRQSTEEAQADARRCAQKHGAKITPETIEAAGYIFVFTTVPREALGPAKALEFYRGRWQIELVFKRLKSILGFGHLRKRDDESARSWLHGKLFVAFAIEALLTYGVSFFPWGYPIGTAGRAQPLPLPGGRDDDGPLQEGRHSAHRPPGSPRELA